MMISMICLEASTSTKMHITNATSKICVTSSSFQCAMFTSSTWSYQLCTNMPVNIGNTYDFMFVYCGTPSAGEIANKFFSNVQIKIYHGEMFCWFLVPGVSTHNRKALISEISKI